MDVQSAVSSVAQEMIDITSNIRWWDENTKKSFQQAVSTNENIITIKQQIDTSIKGIKLSLYLHVEGMDINFIISRFYKMV